MIKQLLNNIILAFMFMALGIVNLIIAPISSSLWRLILGTASAAISFFIAWKIFRIANQIAEIIDLKLNIREMKSDNLTLKILLSNCEQKSGHEATDTTEEEEHNNIHPV